MHQYKKAVPPTDQIMSHTVLKNTLTHDNTLFQEVSGRFEVYWEQLTRSLREYIGEHREDSTNDHKKPTSEPEQLKAPRYFFK